MDYHDMKQGAHHVRTIYEQMMVIIRTDNKQLSFVDIGNISELISPKHQHFTGGILFEKWFYECGKTSLYEWARDDELHQQN